MQFSPSNHRRQHHAATTQAIFLQEVCSKGLPYPREQDTVYPCVVAKRQYTHCWLTRTWLGSADDGDPKPSETIGGGSDLAMGVIETSLAALQTGSALVTNVPFISPIAGLILQALKMRGVRL